MRGEDVEALLAHGAQVQRPLWASTSTKNPDYDDLLYVNSLVGDETVNTMPDATLRATLDHPDFARSYLLDDATCASEAARLQELAPDVSLAAVTDQLEVDGVDAFAVSYKELLGTVAAKMGEHA